MLCKCSQSAVARFVVSLCAAAVLVAAGPRLRAEDVTSKRVLESIDKAKRYLLKAQRADGSWRTEGAVETWTIGVTSLAMLALMNTGMTADDPEIKKGLTWLRKQSDPNMTYEIALMIQALAMAKDGRDKPRVLGLVQKLEESQVRGGGPNEGG